MSISQLLAVLPFDEIITFLIAIFGFCVLYICLQALQLVNSQLLAFLVVIVFIVLLVQFTVNALQQFMTLIHLFTVIYATIYPLLLTFLTVLQSFLSLVSISPIFVAINSLYIAIIDRFLLPILVTSLLLTTASFLYPSISFHRLAQLLRKAVLIFLSLYMMLYASVLAISSALMKSATSFGGTLRKLFEQNIPLVGSIMTEITSLIKQFQFVASSAVGVTALVVTSLTLFIPVASLFLYSLTLQLTASFVEPFMGTVYAKIVEEFAKTLFVMTAIAFIFMSQLFVTVIILYVGVNTKWS